MCSLFAIIIPVTTFFLFEKSVGFRENPLVGSRSSHHEPFILKSTVTKDHSRMVWNTPKQTGRQLGGYEDGNDNVKLGEQYKHSLNLQESGQYAQGQSQYGQGQDQYDQSRNGQGKSQYGSGQYKHSRGRGGRGGGGRGGGGRGGGGRGGGGRGGGGRGGDGRGGGGRGGGGRGGGSDTGSGGKEGGGKGGGVDAGNGGRGCTSLSGIPSVQPLFSRGGFGVSGTGRGSPCGSGERPGGPGGREIGHASGRPWSAGGFSGHENDHAGPGGAEFPLGSWALGDIGDGPDGLESTSTVGQVISPLQGQVTTALPLHVSFLEAEQENPSLTGTITMSTPSGSEGQFQYDQDSTGRPTGLRGAPLPDHGTNTSMESGEPTTDPLPTTDQSIVRLNTIP